MRADILLVLRWAVLAGVAGLSPSGGTAAPRPAAHCARVVLGGEVKAGQEFRRTVLVGTAAAERLAVRLQPLPSGWVLRITPEAGMDVGRDFAEMATPPYRSVSPLLVSTDFSFRAQDALGWNPRRFRFAENDRSFADLRALRQTVEAGSGGARAAEAQLAQHASRQPEGVFDIVDAHLLPGTADQTHAASLVAGHFLTTAHTLDQPADGRSSPLGRITWMRFRIALEVPRGAAPARDLAVEHVPCPAP